MRGEPEGEWEKNNKKSDRQRETGVEDGLSKNDPRFHAWLSLSPHLYYSLSSSIGSDSNFPLKVPLHTYSPSLSQLIDPCLDLTSVVFCIFPFLSFSFSVSLHTNRSWAMSIKERMQVPDCCQESFFSSSSSPTSTTQPMCMPHTSDWIWAGISWFCPMQGRTWALQEMAYLPIA